MKISVVIPVYNEVATIDEIVRRVQAVALEKEIIMVVDGSIDGTRERLGKMAQGQYVKVFRREILNGITLKSKRFGFEPEFTMKIAKRGFSLYKVPISYSGRNYFRRQEDYRERWSPNRLQYSLVQDL